MIAYNNSRSGVRAYDFGDYFIVVAFKTGGVYTYTYGSCSAEDVENMKFFAWQGVGLNTYININKPGYASKSGYNRVSFPYHV